MNAVELLDRCLATRLGAPARAWVEQAAAEIARGVAVERFGALLSMASRHARRELLAPTADERGAAARILEGWEPERWTLLEALRVRLILARRDLATTSAVQAMESAFRFADEG